MQIISVLSCIHLILTHGYGNGTLLKEINYHNKIRKNKSFQVARAKHSMAQIGCIFFLPHTFSLDDSHWCVFFFFPRHPSSWGTVPAAAYGGEEEEKRQIRRGGAWHHRNPSHLRSVQMQRHIHKTVSSLHTLILTQNTSAVVGKLRIFNWLQDKNSPIVNALTTTYSYN